MISGPQVDQSISDDNQTEFYEAKFIETFGSHDDWEEENGEVVLAPPLRTVDEFDSAMFYLYQFRYTLGLESDYHFGRRLLSFYLI